MTDTKRLKFLADATVEQVREIFHLQFLYIQEELGSKAMCLRWAINKVMGEDKNG